MADYGEYSLSGWANNTLNVPAAYVTHKI
jgi:hypothetical protein